MVNLPALIKFTVPRPTLGLRNRKNKLSFRKEEYE